MNSAHSDTIDFNSEYKTFSSRKSVQSVATIGFTNEKANHFGRHFAYSIYQAKLFLQNVYAENKLVYLRTSHDKSRAKKKSSGKKQRATESLCAKYETLLLVFQK